jgi:hypothetical protein
MTADHLPSAVLITRPKPSLQFSKIILLFVPFGYDLEDACPGRESADFAGAAGLSKTKVVDGRNGPGHHDSMSGAASGRTRRTKKSRPIVSVVNGVPSVLGRSQPAARVLCAQILRRGASARLLLARTSFTARQQYVWNRGQNGTARCLLKTSLMTLMRHRRVTGQKVLNNR